MMTSSFEVGAPIVHPIHGAGILKDIDKRQVRGRLLSYYVIDFPYSDLGQVMVPVDMAEKVGLRTINKDANIDDVFSSLSESFSEEEEEESKSFHQRYRDYLEKFKAAICAKSRKFTDCFAEEACLSRLAARISLFLRQLVSC